MKLLITLLLLGALSTAEAQWLTNGNFVSTAANDQTEPNAVADGAGGVFTVWQDARTDEGDIYAQHFDATGRMLWTANGVAVSSAQGKQAHARITTFASASGEVEPVIVWEDHRSASSNDTAIDVYAQHLSSSGQPRWTANGVKINAALALSADAPVFLAGGSEPKIVTTASNELVVVWIDLTHAQEATSTSPRYDIVAQKIAPVDGHALWNAPAAVSGTAAQTKTEQSVTVIGSDVFVSWTDLRNNQSDISQAIPTSIDLYCQRVTTSGSFSFPSGGNQIDNNPSTFHLFSSVVSDKNNGAIVVWIDFNLAAMSFSALAQEINSLGVATWTPLTGVTVADSVFPSAIASDRMGGVIVAYSKGDGQDPATYDVYLQRLNASGALQYSSSGALICGAADGQFVSAMITDSIYGTYVAWADLRNSATTDQDIYVQRCAIADGKAQWTKDGVPLSLAKLVQDMPALTLSTAGNVLVTFIDSSRGDTWDIKANQITLAGTSTADVKMISDVRPQALTLAQNYPNPFASSTNIAFTIPNDDNVTLTVNDALGREVKTLLTSHLAAGSYSASFEAQGLTSGVYTYHLSTANGYSVSKQMIVTK